MAAVGLTALLVNNHAAPPPAYVAHEWGTFTSVQGSDGVLLNWAGADTGELPDFVYSSTRPGLDRLMSNPWGVFSKGGYRGIQRMETPVIYFYTEEPFEADVTVRFPAGYITEWFPQALEVGPSSRPPDRLGVLLDRAADGIGFRPDPTYTERFSHPRITDSLIHWGGVEVLPATGDSGLSQQLPWTDGFNHYFAARRTDAALLRVPPMEDPVPAPEHERFLFYRGVGDFQGPLRVTLGEEEKMRVANEGEEALTHLFALAVQEDGAAFQKLDRLDSSQTGSVRLDLSGQGRGLDAVVESLRREMAGALVEEGLYHAEAEAMVDTWQDSWFEEPGLRVLYILPRAWTDRTLPIELRPDPRELVRVMVGRAELISRRVEREVLECIREFSQADETRRPEVIERFRGLDLGRFAAPAVALATRAEADRGLAMAGQALLAASRAAGREPAPAVATLPARRSSASGG